MERTAGVPARFDGDDKVHVFCFHFYIISITPFKTNYFLVRKKFERVL